jgi:diaminopimelate epimerase
MRSSRWDANGNIYLVTEESLTPERVRSAVEGNDGILEVFRSGEEWVEIGIWNPDGSRAEMSGNGTRIAARWLTERTGATEVLVRVGPREVRARMLESGLIEQDMGEIVVSEPEVADGIGFVAVDVGNPHAVVEGNPDDLPRIGPLLEGHSRFPRRTNVQVACIAPDGAIEARVWERGAGETASSGSSAVAIAAAFGRTTATVRFPGGELAVRFEENRAFLTGPAERL